ncbi:PTS sugar transporter subunit IIC [Collinsella sp. zg1085]|uniref:PTS mannose/fructose/sorbose/N-acetylgalactosamine transporter subunit IIC n=1 Tax=Collinsella sp. zg1085 TaxID=2844380 RepID=UPI001C0CDD9E|nr:PTS sugar transporter subunit IIC [Collinsella sp. zg1085]QWT18024.1 PTS sugar transporter subunit IIC [Collinsella sp. zg1085]
MIVQAILLGLVAMLGNAEYLLGTSCLSRPLVMGTLTGLVMGDLTTGVTIGSTLELAFMGSFSIGASIPPEMISGTVLGTAFTISTGSGLETAITIGLPVASLVLIVKNVGMVFVLPPFVHRADVYAARGDAKGIARMHYLGGFLGVNLIIGLCVALGFYAGGPAVQALLDAIPEWVSNGLKITMGLLPAIGFALLLKMIMNKAVACFFICGFALASYLHIPTTGVAIFGAVTAVVLSQIHHQLNQVPVLDGGIDDDDEDF